MSYIDSKVLAPSEKVRFETSIDVNNIKINNNCSINDDLTTDKVTIKGDLNISASNCFFERDINFSSDTSKISFKNTLYLSGSRVGINKVSPSANLDLVGSLLVEQKTGGTYDILFLSGNYTFTRFQENRPFFIDPVGIANSPRSTIFNNEVVSVYEGEIRVDTNTFCVNTNEDKVLIGTNNSTVTNSKLEIVRSSPGSNFISDPNTLISTYSPLVNSSIWQFMGHISDNSDVVGTWQNKTQGFLISAGYNNGTLNSKHWLITPRIQLVTTFTNDNPPVSINNTGFYFCYYDGPSTNPVNTIVSADSSYIQAAIYTEIGMAGQIDFTGQHRCLPSENQLSFYADKVGLIVCSDGTYCETLDPDDFETTISINESIPKVRLSSKRNDKTVFGVISNKEDLENKRTYSSGRFVSFFDKKENDHRLIINSVGEGGIWICNINGNLENGDFITTCEIPGYGMKQDADDLMNYTVAKITCDCDFDLNSTIYKCEELQFSGSIYRKAFVGCTYHCG